MSGNNHSEAEHERAFGDFSASKTAVSASTIGGPEDLWGLATRHWQGLAVLGILLVCLSYRGQFQAMEEQVQSLETQYAELPEEKALAVAALRSVAEVRQGLSLLVTERTLDVVQQSGFRRGGHEIQGRLSSLSKMAEPFGRLGSTGADASNPAIYEVIGALADLFQSDADQAAGAVTRLRQIASEDTGHAGGIAGLALAEAAQERGELLGIDGSSAHGYLRSAYQALGRSGLVEARLIASELGVGQRALLGLDKHAFLGVYRQWWPRWEQLLKRNDSTATRFVIACGVVEGAALPLARLTETQIDDPLSVAEVEAVCGVSLQQWVRQTLDHASWARQAAFDRVSSLVASAYFDLAMATFLADSEQRSDLRESLWHQYQRSAGTFQGVSERLAPRALREGAYRAFAEAQGRAAQLGETLNLQGTPARRTLLESLPAEFRVKLGVESETKYAPEEPAAPKA